MSTKVMTKINRTGLLARALGLAALAAALLVGSAESSASLDPYFFLRGRGFSKITPRILFVLDTSGSMTGTRVQRLGRSPEPSGPIRTRRLRA